MIHMNRKNPEESRKLKYAKKLKRHVNQFFCFHVYFINIYYVCKKLKCNIFLLCIFYWAYFPFYSILRYRIYKVACVQNTMSSINFVPISYT